MISNCSHDERGKYKGGKAGDQTWGEWTIRKWYNRPWSCVLRHPDAKVRETLAALGEKAAKNNKIGYDQNQRWTYWTQLKRAGYDPSKIKVKCEADCSAGVIANTRAAGYLLGDKKLQNVSATYTGNMRSGFKKAGFKCLTARKYRTSDKYLKRGDILLYDNHHTATNLTDGSLAEEKTEVISSENKTVAQLAREVISGKWGTGANRKKRLTAAGYDYAAVQKKVNELLK